jgi:hypothetical protein
MIILMQDLPTKLGSNHESKTLVWRHDIHQIGTQENESKATFTLF